MLLAGDGDADELGQEAGIDRFGRIEFSRFQLHLFGVEENFTGRPMVATVPSVACCVSTTMARARVCSFACISFTSSINVFSANSSVRPACTANVMRSARVMIVRPFWLVVGLYQLQATISSSDRTRSR